MQNNEASVAPSFSRGPWNKGKLVGAKPPLLPKHVWSIRTKLQIADRKRDLAMFNLAIDSKLRGCDVVALKVEDIAPHGYAVERATVRQKKTGLPGLFGHLEPHRHASLFLAHRCALDGVSVRRNVFHLEGDDIATA